MKVLNALVLGVLVALQLASNGQDSEVAPGWAFVVGDEILGAELAESGDQLTASASLEVPVAASSSSSSVAKIPEADEANDELIALARALEHDPVKIYHWIRDNIDFHHVYGLNKGAIQTYNERSGNSFDQSCLFAALLNECPDVSEIRYKLIYRNYSLSTLRSLHQFRGTGLSQMRSYMNSALRKRRVIDVDIPGDPEPTTETQHQYAWCHVEFQEGSDTYLVNPALKKYEWNAGELAGASDWKNLFGYDPATIVGTLSGAKEDPNGAWIEDVDGSIPAFNAQLEQYTDALIDGLRTQYPGKSLDDLLGYWSVEKLARTQIHGIDPMSIEGYEIDHWVYGENPVTYAQSFVFRRTNNALVARIYSSSLKGQKLSMTFNSSGRATFRVGSQQVAQDPQAVSGGATYKWGVNHPPGPSSFANNIVNKLFPKGFTNGFRYVFPYAWKPAGRRYHQSLENLKELEAADVASDSEEYALEGLSSVGTKYFHEVAMWSELMGRIHGFRTEMYHYYGRSMQTSNGFAVDIPFSRSLPTSANGSWALQTAVPVTITGSALEHSILNQLQGDDAGGLSTVGIVSRALHAGEKMYYVAHDTVSAFNNSAWISRLGGSSAVAADTNAVGKYYLLPEKTNYSIGTYSGTGYLKVQPFSVTAAIGGLDGGWSTGSRPFSPPAISSVADYIRPSFDYAPPAVPQSFGADPVDMASGSFTLDVTDISIGNEPWPRGIEFSRRYSSARKNEESDLSPGWSHNFQTSLSKISNADLMLGGGTAEESAALIVSSVVLRDVLIPANLNVKRGAVGVLATDWGANRLSNSVYSVNLGDKSVSFVEAYPGKVLPARGLPVYLRKNGDDVEIKSRWGNKFKFEPIPPAAGETDPTGEYRLTSVAHHDGGVGEIHYHGSGANEGKINYVIDAYDRRLNFGYTGGKINLLTDPTTNDGPSSVGRNVDFHYNTAGNLWKDEDPEGRSQHYVYNADGLMTHHQDYDQRTIVQNFYDEFNRVERQYMNGLATKEWKIYYADSYTKEVDPKGGEITHHFDKRKRLVGMTDAGMDTGEVDGEGNPIIQYNTSRKVYDDQDHVVKTISEDGDESTNVFDGYHNLVGSTYPRGGGSIDFDHEQVGVNSEFGFPRFRISETTDVEDHVVDYQYDSGNQTQRPDRVVNSAGTTHFAYYPSSAGLGSVARVHTVRDGDNLTTSHTYDAKGNPASVVPPRGQAYATTFVYNDRGDLDYSTAPSGVKTDYTYNQARQVLDVVQDKDGALEAIASTAYNEQGLPKTVTAPADNDGQQVVSRTEYTVTEKVKYQYLSDETTDLLDDDANHTAARVSENRYDTRDWLETSRTNFLSPTQYQEAQLIYYGNKRVRESIAPGNRSSSFVYDGSGRTISASAPGSNAGVRTVGSFYGETVGQDPELAEEDRDITTGYPKLIVTDTDSKTTTAERDRLGRLRYYKNKAGDRYEMRYDALGRQTHVIDPLNATTTYTYKHRGVPAKVKEPSDDETEFTYFTEAGKVGLLKKIEYTSVNTENVGGSSAVSYEHSDSYDANGNVTHFSEGSLHIRRTFDRLDRVKSQTDSNGEVIGYRYYDSGRLHKLIYPGGTENGVGHVEYTYWKTGRLKNVIDKLSSVTTPRTTTYNWRRDGRLESVTRPNGTKRMIGYDGLGRPNFIRELSATDDLIYISKHGYYQTDELQWTYRAPECTDTGEFSFTGVSSSGTNYRSDNSLEQFNGQAIAHDDDGNMTNGPLPSGILGDYEFDSRNRLRNAGGQGYTYGPDGERLTNSEDGGTTYVTEANSGLSKILLRTKNGKTTRYVWGVGLLYEVDDSEQTTTYHFNETGSTIALTDENQSVIERMEYAPFGQTLCRASYDGNSDLHDTPFLFTGFFGNQTDANGLIYMRARYYNPLLRRFLNADPAREAWNWYAYANGNPMSFVDPTGLGVNSVLDTVQGALSVIGLIPIVGNFADAINAGIGIARGDYGGAALALASAVPFAGIGAGVASLGRTVTRGGGRASSFGGNAFSARGGGVDFVRNTGPLGGRLATTRQVNAAQRELTSFGIGFNRGFKGKGGAFNFKKEGAEFVSVPKRPTEIQLFHELTHARQYANLGRESYIRLGQFQREAHVFNQIWKNRRNFNNAEFRDAIQYMRDIRTLHRRGAID